MTSQRKTCQMERSGKCSLLKEYFGKKQFPLTFTFQADEGVRSYNQPNGF